MNEEAKNGSGWDRVDDFLDQRQHVPGIDWMIELLVGLNSEDEKNHFDDSSGQDANIIHYQHYDLISL